MVEVKGAVVEVGAPDQTQVVVHQHDFLVHDALGLPKKLHTVRKQLLDVVPGRQIGRPYQCLMGSQNHHLDAPQESVLQSCQSFLVWEEVR